MRTDLSEPNSLRCPVTNSVGHAVKLVTLKALLKPQSLSRLEPDEAHFFCQDATCEVVYFSANTRFKTNDVNVPVFQKDANSDVLVCYCFGFTRADLSDPDVLVNAESVIREHIAARRCGCEVRNPQGRCCLSNVTRGVK